MLIKDKNPKICCNPLIFYLCNTEKRVLFEQFVAGFVKINTSVTPLNIAEP
jgi:hypothetical protein